MLCPPHPLSSDNIDNGQRHLYFNKNINGRFTKSQILETVFTVVVYRKLMTLIHE